MMCKDCPYGVQNEQGIWDCMNEEDRCVEDGLPNGFDDPREELTLDEDGNWDWEADYEKTLGGGACR